MRRPPGEHQLVCCVVVKRDLFRVSNKCVWWWWWVGVRFVKATPVSASTWKLSLAHQPLPSAFTAITQSRRKGSGQTRQVFVSYAGMCAGQSDCRMKCLRLTSTFDVTPAKCFLCFDPQWRLGQFRDQCAQLSLAYVVSSIPQPIAHRHLPRECCVYLKNCHPCRSLLVWIVHTFWSYVFWGGWIEISTAIGRTKRCEGPVFSAHSGVT